MRSSVLSSTKPQETRTIVGANNSSRDLDGAAWECWEQASK